MVGHGPRTPKWMHPGSRPAWRLSLLPLAVSLLALVLPACNDSKFASSGEKKPSSENAEPSQKTLSLTCDEAGTGSAHLETELTGDGKTAVRIEGEFCGLEGSKQEGQLTVLFVLDISGSMLDNDPRVGDSCGRLKAAEAIMGKLEKSLGDGVELKLASLAFADIGDPALGPFRPEDFRASLTPEIFCVDNGGGTNYQAAFEGARTLLAPMPGTKVIYFISDGLPTRSGAGGLGGFPGSFGGSELDGVYEAGRQAAARLRAEVEDLTLNAIYLGNTQTDPLTGGLPGEVEPKSYLEEITGSADLVKLVDNADALASEILTFETPEISTLDKDSVKGVHKAASFGGRPVELESLAEHPTRKGVWRFTTAPVELFGATGKEITNEIELTVKTDKGDEITAQVVIHFSLGDDP